jgi:ribosomal protein S6--L-glutamate ligase
MIYRPDDFDPQHLEQARAVTSRNYSELATSAGFDFRMVPVHELLPLCVDRPRLMWRGTDLLAERQCFQVDDFSWRPETSDMLAAVRRTVEASSSVLLNALFDGPEYLVTDKLAIIQRACALGLPVAGAVVVPHGRYARQAVVAARAAFGDGPYIVKPRELGMGFGVTKADSPEQLAATIDMTAQCGVGYLIQAFVPNDGDLRVYVIDGEIVGAQYRRPREGSYLANLSQGGASSAYVVPEPIARDTLAIAADLHASCLLVDWLLTPNGPVLNEWSSGFGGFDGLPGPERRRVGKAFFTWARQAFEAGAGDGGGRRALHDLAAP